MPAPPGLIDFDDDGYLDFAYVGDVNGNMWRIDLPAGPGVRPRSALTGTHLAGTSRSCSTTAAAPSGTDRARRALQQVIQPIFFEPALIFIGGSTSPPTLGIAFGTGNRAELARTEHLDARFYYVIDNGQTALTYVRSGATTPTREALQDITPSRTRRARFRSTRRTCVNGDGNPAPGFVLDFGSLNEKTTSTVYSTQGYLSLVTFTPDSVSPCATNGSSFQYRFFFLTGTGYYGQTGTYADFRWSLGEGLETLGQITSIGGVHDMVFYSGNKDVGYKDSFSPGVVRTIQQNWKEQQ